jgi:hypothetical protein
LGNVRNFRWIDDWFFHGRKMIRFLMFIGGLVFLGLVLVWIVVMPNRERISKGGR